MPCDWFKIALGGRCGALRLCTFLSASAPTNQFHQCVVLVCLQGKGGVSKTLRGEGAASTQARQCSKDAGDEVEILPRPARAGVPQTIVHQGQGEAGDGGYSHTEGLQGDALQVNHRVLYFQDPRRDEFPPREARPSHTLPPRSGISSDHCGQRVLHVYLPILAPCRGTFRHQEGNMCLSK